MVAVRYRKPETRALAWRELHRQRFALLRDKWILIAYSVKDREVRHYVLMRMHEVKFTGATFTPPKDFNGEAHL